MFFCPELLKKRGHPFFLVWIASTQQGTRLKKYLPLHKMKAVNVPEVADEILRVIMLQYPPSVPRSPTDKLPNFSLYLAAKLVFGSCVILRNQASLLYDDLANVFLRMKQLRWSDTEGDIVKLTFKKPKRRENVEQTNDDNHFDCGEEGVPEFTFYDDEPLVFLHCVPEASITLQDDICTLHLNEDMSFGDEAEFLDSLLEDSAYPAFGSHIGLPALMNTEPHGPKSPQAVVNWEEQQQEYLDVGEDQMKSPTTLMNTLPHDPRISPTFVDSQEQQPEYAHDSIENQRRSPPAADIQGNEDVQQESLHQATDHLVLEGNEVHVTEHGLVAPTDIEEPGTSDVQRSPHLAETDNPPEPSLPTESTAVEIGSPTDRYGGRDLLDELPEIRRVPRQPRWRRRPAVDDIIEIPDAEMRERIKNEGKDTVRKETWYHEYMRTFIVRKWYNTDQMKQPGLSNNLHESLKPYFMNAFVTEPCENMDSPPALDIVRTESPHQPEEEMIRDTMANDTPILEETAEQFPETSVQLPKDLLQERPRLQSVDFMDLQSTDDLTRTEAPADDLTMQITPPRKDYSRKRGHPTQNSSAKRPRLSFDESLEPLPHQVEQVLDVDPQQEVSTSITLPETFVSASLQPPEVFPFLDEVAPNTENEPLEIRAHISTEDVAMPHLSILASPSTSQREITISLPLSPFVTSETVLNQLKEVVKQSNGKEISIHHLCKPGVTRRRKAAGVFSALLELRQRNELTLKQEYVGELPEPVIIIRDNDRV